MRARNVLRRTLELAIGAAHRNSENVLVTWGNPKLAAVYLKHFERNIACTSRFQEQRARARLRAHVPNRQLRHARMGRVRLC